MTKPDVETIFPRLEIETDKDGASVLATSGMTLRDYFAGQALAGYSSEPGECYAHDPKGLAEDAYLAADAMLAEREKGE